ncbi:MAG: hypothetical protein NDF54_04590 [archaeon GB-1867-035]|nr:hypothetical protein [Candidatus Culexmicrobium profundum]
MSKLKWTSLLLSVIFAIALTYATLSLTFFVNGVLINYFPDLGFQFERIREFMSFVRPIGYVCFCIVITLILLGFLVDRIGLSFLGSLTLFLPVFGYFAFSMFFLAGLGILRVLWIPLLDYDPRLLKLGDVAYLPYMIVVYLFALIGVDVRIPFSCMMMGLGYLILILGFTAWLYGKFNGLNLIDFWIYKYSRHPQYLGFIIWSYGLMLLGTLNPFPRGGYNPGPSLPWIISTLTIIAIALREEASMINKLGEDYLKYRSKTPFLIPLPKAVSNIISWPVKLVIKKSYPENLKEIAFTFIIYLIILILSSLPFLLLNWPPGYGWASWPSI